MTIERAAKAILAFWMTERFSTADARAEARAALEAIAEPTPYMIKTGAMAAGKHFMFDEKFEGIFMDQFIEHIWRAMHAAMIEECS